MKLGIVVDGYLSSLACTAKPGTLVAARSHAVALARHLDFSGTASLLSRLDVDRFIQGRAAEGVSRATVNGGLRILRAALRWGLEARLLDELPIAVRVLREGRRLPATLSGAQIQSLLAAAGPDARLALLIAARAGLRHQEILHLTWADVDLGELRVTAKAGWTPKSHHERAVPIGPGLAAALAERRPEAGGGWLFPGRLDGPRHDLQKEVRAAFREAGFCDPADKPGLHQLRRTWATELLGRGADIETVRQLGGWADLSTVQRYVGSTDARKRAAIESLEDHRFEDAGGGAEGSARCAPPGQQSEGRMPAGVAADERPTAPAPRNGPWAAGIKPGPPASSRLGNILDAGGGASAARGRGWNAALTKTQTGTSPASSPRCDCGGPLKPSKDGTLICVRCARVYGETR